jgi:hypothetical protein
MVDIRFEYSAVERNKIINLCFRIILWSCDACPTACPVRPSRIFVVFVIFVVLKRSLKLGHVSTSTRPSFEFLVSIISFFDGDSLPTTSRCHGDPLGEVLNKEIIKIRGIYSNGTNSQINYKNSVDVESGVGLVPFL